MSPTGTNLVRHRRSLAAAVAVVAVCAAGQAGIAPASAVFDEPGYTLCTATTTPAPDQNFDTVATACCVQNAGVPASTTYGVGCVAPVENPPADYRPTIVLPSRPTPPEAALPGEGLLPGDVPPP